uniref:Putative cytidylyltransferase n=1 Tax=viral metagenome TaxID=1070528 RepID=A0A6M3L9V6_9ZZZZ
MKQDRILILLPVKCDSKRLPGKNLRLLSNMSLWRYSYRAAYAFWWSRNGGCPTGFVVSSENKDLGNKISSSFFRLRPKWLSEDPYQLKDVAFHVIDEKEIEGNLPLGYYSTLIIVQPSNPFITSEDIENCYKLFLDNNRRCVRSVTKTEKNTMKSFMTIGDTLFPANPAFNRMRDIEEKDMPDTYFGNGSIIVCDVGEFKREKTLLLENTIGYKMGGIDIDTENNFLLAEILMKGEK